MTRGALPLLLLLSLPAGPGCAADAEAGLATPRVSCDLLDVRTEVSRGGSTAAWADPRGGTPAIRQVGGRGAPPGSGGVLKTGLGAGSAMPATLELGPRTLRVAPGTTALIEIAIDHLNRIVTPFRNPVVHTVSAASTSVDGRVVYVATASEEPVALYIGDGPSSELALSLTLAPRFVPPREIRLEVPGYRGSPADPGLPEPAVQSALSTLGVGGRAAYAETLVDLLRALAQRRLPAGYRVAEDAGIEARCLPALKVLKTRSVQGADARVLVLGLRNTGTATVQADASACNAQGSVAAVGAWPRKTLAPGQDTELYLALQPGAEPGGATDRAR